MTGLRRRFQTLLAALALTAPLSPLRAGDVTLYGLPNLALQYEGTGYRQFDEGWELKVKPQGGGAGVRWRRSLSEKLAFQTQYWRNEPYFSWEDGNSVSATLRQTGQTRLSMQAAMADVRRPLEESGVEAVAGVQGVFATFERKDIVFNGSSEPGRPTERLAAGGAYLGFHGGNASAAGEVRRARFFWDWEATFGHLFLTRNAQTAGGGSIHRNGYTYYVRLEAGVRWDRWRFAVGQVRQMFEIMVPGGKTLPSGAAASLPINKIDFDSPFVGVGYEF